VTLLWWQWLIAVGCAMLVGVAKTGVPGMGIFVVPVLSLSLGSAMTGAGFLLPLLSVADIFAVAYYRRHAQLNKLWELSPWVLVGMALGSAVLYMPEAWFHGYRDSVFNMMIGLLVLAMIVVHWWQKQRSQAPVPTDVGHTARYGITAGFATTLANAAGPVMNLYLLSKKLPKEEFIATGAWYFLVVNLSKVPIYAGRGMITWDTLTCDAILAPAVVVGALFGRRVFDHIPQRAFERTVFILAALAALMLLVPKELWSGAGSGSPEVRKSGSLPAQEHPDSGLSVFRTDK